MPRISVTSGSLILLFLVVIGFMPSRFPVLLGTPGNDGLCGVKLSVGKKYILSGDRKGSIRSIEHCNFIVDEDSLSYQQLEYLFSCAKQSYRRNCECKDIKENTRSHQVLPQKGCKLPNDEEKWPCYFTTGICTKRLGKCQWRNLKNCD